MNTSNLLNVLLAAAIVILSVKIAFFSAKPSAAAGTAAVGDSTAVVLNNIMTRTSIRAYQDRPIEDEKLEKLLRAAMAAPSAGNKQPWNFVVVKDKNILRAISANLNTMKMAEKAPLAIIVCGDMTKTFPGEGLDYWVEDASAASENLLLAAHSMGLGAVWCGIYPLKERISFLKELLHLPENIVPLNVVPIGYPAEDPAPKDKWKPERIHYDTWDGVNPAVDKDSKTASATWEKIDIIKEWRENPFDFFTNALALASGKQGDMNVMTIGWGGLGVLWGWKRPVVTVYVREDRYTYNYMEKNDYFTVTAFTPDYEKTLKYLGSTSGRDEDKVKGSGLTVKFTDLGNPVFEEGRLVLECKKLYGAPFNPEGFGEFAKKEYSTHALHDIYIGEIVNAWRVKQD